MINFRYHVVSLTSVFLALAIGLVLGTAALNGPVADDLNNRVSALNTRNERLRQEAKQLKSQLDSQADFAVQAAPMLLANRLVGRSVLVVTTDTTDASYRDEVVKTLQQAGATLTGKVRIDSAFTDPKQEAALQDLASQLVPAGVRLPTSGSGVESAASLLATALVAGGPNVSEASRTSILSGFSSLRVVTVEGDIRKAADAVVVVAGVGTDAATGADADKRDENQLTTLRQFDLVAKHMVLAGPQAKGPGNPVAAIRGDDTLANQISTVDDVSTPEGQIVAALTLAEQFSGRTGHYGSGDGATARVPDLLKK